MKSEDAILLGALGLVGVIAYTVLTKKPAGTPTTANGPVATGVGPNNVQIPTNMPSMSVSDPLADLSDAVLNPW